MYFQHGGSPVGQRCCWLMGEIVHVMSTKLDSRPKTLNETTANSYPRGPVPASFPSLGTPPSPTSSGVLLG